MSEQTCPMHTDEPMHDAVRINRRILGLPPQPCACPAPDHPAPGEESEAWLCLHCGGEHETHEGDCCCHAPTQRMPDRRDEAATRGECLP